MRSSWRPQVAIRRLVKRRYTGQQNGIGWYSRVKFIFNSVRYPFTPTYMFATYLKGVFTFQRPR
jgi:hypothetical protein